MKISVKQNKNVLEKWSACMKELLTEGRECVDREKWRLFCHGQLFFRYVSGGNEASETIYINRILK